MFHLKGINDIIIAQVRKHGKNIKEAFTKQRKEYDPKEQ
jgi:hypothetical protein